MSNNPLFPDNLAGATSTDDAAVELIRSKVAKAYGEEPSATGELAEAEARRTVSKHQQFILELSQANKSLAEIQTGWHRYYTRLPDTEKREVWDEFYAANQHTPYQKLFQKQQPVASRSHVSTKTDTSRSTAGQPSVSVTSSGVTIGDHSKSSTSTAASSDGKSLGTSTHLKARIQNKVSANGKLGAKHHLQSLLFGVGMGALVLVILLFSFLNEYIVAPFIQPSRTVTNAPIIVSDMTAAQAATPSVIVPSINIQIPIDFTLKTNDESAIESSLNNGVVHYASTVFPGQNGNAAFFGHSSQNIFNNGKYKFAFVALHLVKTGDIFYITYNGKIYAYQVFAREIVPPTQVSVLGDTKGKQATATLITCDPPGFSTNRLVVWGEQISPNPATNTTAAPSATTAPAEITSNGPTLWTRLWRDIEFWN